MTEMISDPQEIARAAALFQGEEDFEVETVEPPSNEVFLPGGYINKDGSLVKLAEIRELNGSDEEALAKSTNANRALNVIINRGLVSLGGEPVSKEVLDNLLSGDRDAILLAIRNITFGSKIEYSVFCSSCSSQQIVEVDLEEDVESVNLEDPFNDRIFTVQGKAGEIAVALPNGITSNKFLDSENKSVAEMVTEILSGCILTINDEPSLGRTTALQLGIADRELITAEIYKRTPGPRLGEVKKACEACDAELTLSLSLASLFRLQ
jgi:hypothetical protein